MPAADDDGRPRPCLCGHDPHTGPCPNPACGCVRYRPNRTRIITEPRSGLPTSDQLAAARILLRGDQ